MDLTCSFDPRTYYEVFNTLREMVDSECWMGGCNTIALLWYEESTLTGIEEPLNIRIGDKGVLLTRSIDMESS